MSEADLIAARRQHLAALRSRGLDPFAVTRFETSSSARAVKETYAELAPEEEAPESRVRLAGRLMSIRTAGKTLFADLVDRTDRIQIYVRKDAVGEDAFGLWKEIDRGDVLGVEGTVFRSKMGELTVRVESFRVLSKSLQPLPDKWHGLQDVEKRYRQRYVDLIMNADVREVMLARSRIVSEMRRFIDARGFFEMETPVLLNIAGGATARRFTTRSNALDIPLDLRIATELNLKRLIVGGLERVYEIGRTFRNEGISTRHNPEFTMLELYAAYWSRDEMLAFNEDLIAHLVRFVTGGSETLAYGEHILSFAQPFARIGFLAGIEQYGGSSFGRARLLDPAGAAGALAEAGLAPSPSHAHALDKLFEHFVEPHLVQPTFVMDQPVALSPLAKRKPDDPELTDRYELFVAHMEVSNAFSELNDPDDQRGRFEAQINERAAGDEEVPPPDWDFVTALEYGMPPTAGIGIGIDRLVMLLTNQSSIRDVLLFPLQRPLPVDPASGEDD